MEKANEILDVLTIEVDSLKATVRVLEDMVNEARKERDELSYSDNPGRWEDANTRYASAEARRDAFQSQMEKLKRIIARFNY